jgi:signal transduction histidine kinase
MMALGEAALQLPWLSPCAASLLALTKPPGAAVWSRVRHDPGCVLLVIRHALPPAAAAGLSLFPALLRDAAALEAARTYLENQADRTGWVNWDEPSVRPVYQAALACARLASHLAEQTDCGDPDNAWVGGLLAPLGWLAACAADPARAAEALEAWQRGREVLPGFDPAGVARRLARRWRLPAWLSAVVGYLGLPVDVARGLGADPELFQVVQLAVGLVEQRGCGLGLACGRPPAELLAALGLTRAEAEADCSGALGEARQCLAAFRWERPHALALLPELLRLAAENRRLGDLPVLERLQDDVDVLTGALHEQYAGEGERLEARKLSALVELAAGASHEINNPLAVISGQAQYLLKRIADGQTAGEPAICHLPYETVQRSLQTVVGQTQRIHQLLTDLLQFARPPAPQRALVDVDALVRDAAASVQGPAEERGVRLVCQGVPAPVALYADPAQLARALAALLRNAVEAAPAQGWAGVRVELARPGRLDFVVEDSGRGPPPDDREHLFDPFYSGRKAGRGRGLGLPTAWRLARQHGGDVRLVPSEEGVTRFVLSLPLAGAPEAAGGEPAPPSAAPKASVA